MNSSLLDWIGSLAMIAMVFIFWGFMAYLDCKYGKESNRMSKEAWSWAYLKMRQRKEKEDENKAD